MRNKIFIILILSVILLLIYHRYHFDHMIYIDNFLKEDDLRDLKNHIRNVNKVKKNSNNLISKTLNTDIFYKSVYIDKISKLVGKNIYKSNIPIEYRIYNKSQGMRWHSDILLYDKPQYECVYTISNNSDSTTDYIDHWGIKHKVWTKPNSLMIVRANGYKHGVNPVNKGRREIIKLIYTPTDKINYKNIYSYNNALNGNT